MRAAVAALAAAFALASSACPSHAVSETDAQEGAGRVFRDVSAYSARHPGAPGSLVEWADGDLVTGRPLLIHSYPSLEPGYYYVPLTSVHGGEGGFVTLGAVDGRWQAYGRRAADFPSVTREDAVRAVRRTLGLAVAPESFRAVSMPDKRLCWHWRSPDGASEFLISASDTTDVRTGADTAAELTAGPMAEPLPRAPDAAPDAHTGAVAGRPLEPRRSARTTSGRLDRSYPAAYDIPGVPHHYQLTSYNCGAAVDQMVMDYWGPEIDQQDVADAANTGPGGTHLSDMMRAGHFSAISSAVHNPALHGYDERRLGYGALECYWSQPDENDPDFPDRHNDLKSLISAGYPIIIVTRYDVSSYGTHARVAKGYDDGTGVYIVHDPWYQGVYQGPDVHFNQDFLVDELWPRSQRWGALIAPWEVTVDAPAEVLLGVPFTVTAHVVYTGPHPFGAQDEAHFPTVTLLPSNLCGLAPGETATRTLSGYFSDSGCAYDAVSWDIVADTLAQTGVLELLARGLVHDSSSSYASYSDSIGGRGEAQLSVIDPDLVTVDAAGGGHFTDIQDALDFVRDGDAVEVLPGTYRGPGNRNLSFHGKNLRLRGVDGPNVTVIDCDGAGRGFVLTDGEGRDALIEGFTVANGRAPGSGCAEEAGGGIYLNGASPTIRNVVLRSNSSPGAAGGMCCLNQASPLLERCTFRENQAALRGGAVTSGDGSVPEFVNCTLALNAAPECGGIFCSASSPLLTDTIIYGSPDGAAVACEQGAAPVMAFCCIYGNAGGDDLPGSCTAQGMLFADPLLCDPARGALQLQECSPCIGSGASGGHVGAFAVRCACVTTAQPSIKFRLRAARPSPFTDSTVLQLDVPPNTGHVTLAVYNVRGQLVRTLVDRALPPGCREFVWDGMDDTGRPVSAGTYFARCESDAGSDTRKLVLMR
jgi:hypothetical protein